MPMTYRNSLPLLSVSQAHKEITHNETLFIIDFLLNPVAEEARVSPPLNLVAADAGKCWIVGAVPTGSWIGHAQNIACWTGDGWRFAAPMQGMSVWLQIDAVRICFMSGNWELPPSISDPQAGAVIDIEARATLTNLLAYFRQFGVLLS